MTEYIPSTTEWVRDQVELYEKSNGQEGYELRGLPVIIVTHRGRRTGAIRKTPLMRVKHHNTYVLVASMGGAPKNPVWYYNLIESEKVELRDRDHVFMAKIRLVNNAEERAQVWAAAVEAYPPYEDYQDRTTRCIPIFIAEPILDE
ncbi:MAG: nitroreductase [Chloroflexi bacterium]|nr:nitroreductase [Chloroflexota bacterium]|tara:strand:- start:1250 stop:1687 length:438 start_codon:yes stop_codon:yes gene_type:complete